MYLCVFISKLMVCILIYSQYPLRPAHLSYDTSGVVGARVKPRQQKMEIDMAIPTHGEHYSRSRGEQMARAVDCTSSEPCYKRYFSYTSSSSFSYSFSHLLLSSAPPPSPFHSPPPPPPPPPPLILPLIYFHLLLLFVYMDACTHPHMGVVLLFLCSGLLDSQTLVSDKAAQTTSQFVAAVLKDGKE